MSSRVLEQKPVKCPRILISTTNLSLEVTTILQQQPAALLMSVTQISDTIPISPRSSVTNSAGQQILLLPYPCTHSDNWGWTVMTTCLLIMNKVHILLRHIESTHFEKK